MKEFEAPQKSMSGGEGLKVGLDQSFPLLGETPDYLGTSGGSQDYNPKKKSQPKSMKFLG